MDSFKYKNNVLFEDKKCARTMGVLLATLSSLCYTMCALFVKFTTSMDGLEIACLRSCFGFILVSLYCQVTEKPIAAWRQAWVWASAPFSMCYYYLFTVAVQNLPMGDAFAMYFVYLTFSWILASIFLKEPCDWLNTFVMLFAFFGTVLVVQPPFLLDLLPGQASNECHRPTVRLGNVTIYNTSTVTVNNHHETGHSNETSSGNSTNCVHPDPEKDPDMLSLHHISRVTASAMIIFSALGSALSVTALRKGTKIPLATIESHSHLFAIVPGIFLTATLGRWVFPPEPHQWIYLLAATLAMVMGHFMQVLALEFESEALVGTVRIMQIPFAYVLQVTFFREFSGVFAAVGATIVTLAVLVSAVKALAVYERNRLRNRRIQKLFAAKEESEMKPMLGNGPVESEV